MAYCGDSGVGPIFLSLCRNWQSEALSAGMIVPNAAESCRGADLVEAIPRRLKWLAYRREDWPRRLTERKLLGILARFDAVYSFPNISLATIRHIQKSGRPVVIERINCFSGKARDILQPEYKQLGVRPQKAFHKWDVEPERTQIEVADFHFAPSPEVEKSLLEIGVPPEKIIVTSYGWSPDRFPDAANPREQRQNPTILFVGYVCVRKGVHLLLRAWERAGIRGRLVLCGLVEPAMAQLLADAQRRSDVVYLPPTQELGWVYRDADIFAFPSLEEGSPLVTYEAMAHGLPVVTSPMGAGGIVRNGVDGVVIPPHDTDAWVEALRQFARSPELRSGFGAAARLRAEEFTWDKVAKRRSDAMVRKFSGPGRAI
jgi:glycosyltransferase involved in cell wall biosynthesis